MSDAVLLPLLWVHPSDFIFGGGAFRGYMKGTFAPFLASSLAGGLAAALTATSFLFLGFFFGRMSMTGGSGLGGRDRRRDGKRIERREGEMKEAAGGENE
jgi:hypothetical protein